MKKRQFRIVLGFTICILLFVGLQVWQPWLRQPVTFYEPLVLPLEAIKGDVIVLSNGNYIVIKCNKRINSIEYDGEKVVIKGTRYVNLWELLLWK